MHITIYSSLMALLWCAVFSSLIALLRRKNYLLKNLYTFALLFLFVMTFIRLLFPFDLFSSYVIASEQWLPALIDFLTKPYLHLGVVPVSIVTFLLAVWLVESTHQMIKMLSYLAKTKKLYRGLSVQASKTISELIQTLPNVPKHLHVIQHNSIPTPMLVGFYNPTLLLPAIELSQTEWEFIICHELTHLRNKHPVVKMLVYMAHIVFWWLPGFRSIYKDIDHILEIQCDTIGLLGRSDDEKKAYVQTLRKVAQFLRASDIPSISLCFATVGDDFLLQRCELIRNSNHRKSLLMTVGLILLGISLFLLSYLVIIQPRHFPDLNQGEYAIADGSSRVIALDNGDLALYVNDTYNGLIEDNEDVYEGTQKRKGHVIKP